MSFKDRYGITRFKRGDKKVSLSIDLFDDITAVMMLVPNINEREHSHIELSRQDLKILMSCFQLKGFKSLSVDYYTFIFKESTEKNMFLKMDVFCEKDLYLEVDFKLDEVKEIIGWIDEYLSLTKEELVKKYNKDLGC